MASTNRLLRGECLRCGDTLILDHKGGFNEYHCCSSCTDYINRSVYEAMKKKKQRNPKFFSPLKKNTVCVTDISQEPE